VQALLDAVAAIESGAELEFEQAMNEDRCDAPRAGVTEICMTRSPGNGNVSITISAGPCHALQIKKWNTGCTNAMLSQSVMHAKGRGYYMRWSVA
jgi:hypothetical protein